MALPSAPITSSHYFDRRGAAIDLTRWAKLWEDNAYRFVERTWVVQGKIEIVTVWNGFDPYRVRYDDAPPRIFQVAELVWANDTITDARNETMHATEAGARAAHAAMVVERRLSIA